ncbi:hypothetical protein ABZX95_50030 [Streptomyces sp. NPDC004232]|uniref:hypothetical protein n=1 Tax=Streptomyces sp. NPDC004232 TaxID=3154454 RepID=UPI0033A70DD3
MTGDRRADRDAALREDADPRETGTARFVAELKADEDFRRLRARHDARPSRDGSRPTCPRPRADGSIPSSTAVQASSGLPRQQLGTGGRRVIATGTWS